MDSPTQILPGVKSIGWLDCRHLHRSTGLLFKCFGELVAVSTTVHRIGWFADASCRCDASSDGGKRSEKATLVFSTDEALPDGVPLGFVVEAPDGSMFLIGSREPPLPVVSVTRTTGSANGGRAGFSYEITHLALQAMLPCLALMD